MRKQKRVVALVILAVIALTVFSSCAETEKQAKYLPKAIDYFYEGEYDSRQEYEYDAAGNVTRSVFYTVDEKGEKILDVSVETDYDDKGNKLEERTYTADSEKPYERTKNTYENGAMVKSETYTLVDNESVLTSYIDYENDSKNRPVKAVQYTRDDGSSEFELYSETVYAYKGDFETPISTSTRTISDKEQFISETTTVELDDQGKELVYESFTDNEGEKIVYEYDGDLLKKAILYQCDNEAKEWALYFTIVYTYNDKGNTTEEYYTYMDVIYKTIYEYDESGEKLLKQMDYSKELEADEFEMWGKGVYEY